jgi:hypothetical protein
LSETWLIFIKAIIEQEPPENQSNKNPPVLGGVYEGGRDFEIPNPKRDGINRNSTGRP